MTTADVVVIGGGSEDTSTAWRLARLGGWPRRRSEAKECVRALDKAADKALRAR